MPAQVPAVRAVVLTGDQIDKPQTRRTLAHKFQGIKKPGIAGFFVFRHCLIGFD
jgi:hypothetical protein